MREYKSKFSGSWYPGTRSELTKLLDTFFNNIKVNFKDKHYRGVIAPHAGMIYSGQTAAFSFKALQGTSYDTVVILAPPHRSYLDKVSTFDYDQISTPLGNLNVDKEINDFLLKENPIYINAPSSYEGEHSFELELPFLQYISEGKEFNVLPLIVGDLTLDEFKTASDTLTNALKNRNPAYIVSSDFTHYGEGFSYVPFEDNIPENLKKLDLDAISQITKNDMQGFEKYIEDTGATICGKNPILMLMSVFKEKQGELLYYTSSGELTKDYSHSVSYASIAF